MSLRGRLSRVLFRAAAKMSGGNRTYAGAALNRLMADWIWGPVSAQHELLDMRTLRDRGRELERDNSYGGRYVELCSENIISDSGIRLQAMNYRGDELDTRVNDEIERGWTVFGEQLVGDASGMMSMLDLQTLAVERWKGGDGEVLIQLLPGRGEHGLQWMMLDPDQLDETYWRARASVDRDGPDVNEIVAGVEVDRANRPVAYHLWTTHPSDLTGRRERIRVDAEWIIHLFRPSRPGQRRGITRFARVMKDLRHLGGLTEAVLVNMRASACKMGFISPGPDSDPIADQNGEPKLQVEASPGTIDVLPRGYQFEEWNPNQPTAQHREVVHESLYAIAAGFGVAFTSLTGNLTGANYGSQRGGLLSERRGWRRDQVFVAQHLLVPLFRTWLRFASLKGAVQLPRADYRLYLEHTWLYPGWDWIDPAKDIDGGLAEVRAGLESLTGLAAKKGRDFETVLAQRQRETRLAEQYGVEISLTDAFADSTGELKDDSNGDGTGTPSEADADGGSGDRTVRRLRLARKH